MELPPTRRLRRDERDLALDTLVASFDDDPLFRWMLPDPRDRRAWVRWFHDVSLRASLAHDTAWTVAEGAAAGVISVLPPGVKGPDVWAWISALGRPPRRLPTKRLAWTGLRVQQRLDALHPVEPVVYVHVLGAHPGRKGHGLGGALLRQALEFARSRGVPAALETSNPVNLGFYRRFGFEVEHTFHVDDAPPLWTMKTPGVPR